MQNELFELLRCPVGKDKLDIKVISSFNKEYEKDSISEVKEGILFSKSGFVFPIIDGIPRMLIESIYNYSDFFKKHLENYNEVKELIEKNYPGLLKYCIKKNKRTKESFAIEWGFLNHEKEDKIWHDDYERLGSVFLEEMGESKPYFISKSVVDVGCGHGIMTSKIAEISSIAVGVELSRAVERAYQRNKKLNAHYLQGDLQFLPFANSTFDVLYSSGVIHHSNNTELSLSLIEPILKENGKISLWLYHPQKYFIHNASMRLRKMATVIPMRLLLILILIFIFPFTYLFKLIKNKNKPNYREEIIDLLDTFTPEYRYEIPHDLAKTWLLVRTYSNIEITTINRFGFSIVGIKS